MSRRAVRVSLPVVSLLSAVVAVLLPALLLDGGADARAYCYDVTTGDWTPDVTVCQLPEVPNATPTP